MMTRMLRLRQLMLAAAVALATGAPVLQGRAQEADLFSYRAAAPGPRFASPDAAVNEYKAALAGNDFDRLARLVGLDPVKLRSSEGVMDTFERMKKDAAVSVVVEDAA